MPTIDYKMYTTLDLDDAEKYEKDGCTWIIGKVRNSKDLYATKFRYIKHHYEGVDNMGAIEMIPTREFQTRFPYAVNELKYIKGTPRDKYLELFKKNMEYMTLAETMINMFGGLITVPKRFRRRCSCHCGHSDSESESDDDFS